MQVEEVLKLVSTDGQMVFNPSTQKFADFLGLFIRTHHSVSAIKGYKAMQNSIFQFRGVDLPTDPILHVAFSACSKKVPRPICRVPAWNLNVALKALVPPFRTY